ncbi:heme oxygenase (biliverdin-producing) [Bradyrhizobium sp.]|uniref:biliverdin-producing heme oxygenase n=1 Tax=Bradyrhizobium sp. TaxID=376 RepID=UPI003C62CAAB
MTAIVADHPAPASVVTALYFRTRALHVEAERTGIMRDLLHGDASRAGYVLLLRNLFPAYCAIEQGLERHQGSPLLGVLAHYRLDRAPAIESDLAALCGERWINDIPLLPAGELYASRIAEAAEGDGAQLIAHAYTRYLGDLSGGQILKRLLSRSLELRSAELTFYDFPRFPDLDALKANYRQALDQAAAQFPNGDAIVEEGVLAFSHNIALSCAVQAAAARESAATR